MFAGGCALPRLLKAIKKIGGLRKTSFVDISETALRSWLKNGDLNRAQAIHAFRFAQAKEKEVKIRHATALALVGWYLMLPPVHHGTADPGVPLSKWEVADAFDRATDCDNDHHDQTLDAEGLLKKKGITEGERDGQSSFWTLNVSRLTIRA